MTLLPLLGGVTTVSSPIASTLSEKRWAELPKTAGMRNKQLPKKTKKPRDREIT